MKIKKFNYALKNPQAGDPWGRFGMAGGESLGVFMGGVIMGDKDREPFDIDVIQMNLDFVHGILQLANSSAMEMSTMDPESLKAVFIDAEARLEALVNIFRGPAVIPLQNFYNKFDGDPQKMREYVYKKREA